MQSLGNRAALLVAVALIWGCASSQVSQTSQRPYAGPKPSSIALSPGGGVLGEAIGLELFNRGYTVVDPDETARMVGRSDLSEFEISQAAGLSALRDKGIDALLVVKSVAGNDGRPQSATARLTATNDGQIISAVTWQNGWGGAEGSPADRTMRKDVAEAAREIVNALSSHLGPP